MSLFHFACLVVGGGEKKLIATRLSRWEIALFSADNPLRACRMSQALRRWLTRGNLKNTQDACLKVHKSCINGKPCHSPEARMFAFKDSEITPRIPLRLRFEKIEIKYKIVFLPFWAVIARFMLHSIKKLKVHARLAGSNLEVSLWGTLREMNFLIDFVAFG